MTTNEVIEYKFKKIQIVQYARKCLASFGFIPNQRPLNRRVLMVLLQFFLNFLLHVMFMLYEASNFSEYTYSIFNSLATGINLFALILLTIQIRKLFDVIDFGQKFFENGK